MSNIERSIKEQMGEAILLHERTAYYLHTQQRSQDLRRAPAPERIASLMRTMNNELSSPDEHRESVIASHTKDILRNNNVKSQLAVHMALQAQIHRLSRLIEAQDSVDDRLMGMIDDLDPDQLIVMQKNLHNQMSEIVDYLRGVGSDSIEAIMSVLTPEKGEEAQATLAAIEKLAPEQREKITSFLQKVYHQAQSKVGIKNPVTREETKNVRKRIEEERRRKNVINAEEVSDDPKEEEEED